MKKHIFFLLAMAIQGTIMATTWQVEVGGNPNQGQPAYYAPQHFTIEVGDDIVWTWVNGFHSVTAVSGPEIFDSGEHFSPFTFEYTFTLPGEYRIECSVGSHADTQFADIVVEQADQVSEVAEEAILIYYNSKGLPEAKLGEGKTYDLQVIDQNGRVVYEEKNISEAVFEFTYPVSKGVYFARFERNGLVFSHRIVKR